MCISILYGKMHTSSLFSATYLYSVPFSLTDWFAESNFQECSICNKSLMYELSSSTSKMIKLYFDTWMKHAVTFQIFPRSTRLYCEFIKTTWETFSTLKDYVSSTANGKRLMGEIQKRCKDFTLLHVKYTQYTGYYVDKFQRRKQARVSEVANW